MARDDIPNDRRGAPRGRSSSSSSGASGSSPGAFLTQRFGPLPVWGYAAAGLVLILVLRRKSAASTAATSAATGTTASAGTPTSATGPPLYLLGSSNSPGGTAGTFTGGAGGTVSSPGQTSSTGTMQTTAIQQPPASVSSINPGGPQQPGYGIVQTALGPMVYLGVRGQPTYGVGGGAPVYFGTANSLSQGPAQQVTGAGVYTPAQYAGQVTKSAGLGF